MSQSSIVSTALGSVAFMVLASATSAQQFDPEEFVRLQQLPGSGGTGLGTVMTPALGPGAADAVLVDGRGAEQYTVTMQLFTDDEFGPGTRVLYGSLDGWLYPYKLTIVPSEPEPDAVLAGEWYLHENGVGYMSAVMYDRGGGLAFVPIGVIEGSFEITAEGPSFGNLMYNPYQSMTGSAGNLVSGAFSIGAPDLIVDPPPPSSNDGPDVDASSTGNHQAAGGMEQLNQGSPSSQTGGGSSGISSSAQSTGAHSAATMQGIGNAGCPQDQDPDPSGPASSAQGAGSHDAASGATGISDYGDPQAVPDGVSSVPGPQIGRLELEWRIFD